MFDFVVSAMPASSAVIIKFIYEISQIKHLR